MKAIFTTILSMCFTLGLMAQSPKGAWETSYKNEIGEEVKLVVIFADGYQVATWYQAESGEFIRTNGGSWTLKGNQMTEVIEFDSAQPERVGTSVTFEVAITDKTMEIVGQGSKLSRLDNGTPGQLAGAWLMSGRKRNGEVQTRDTNRPRKTMKILSGTRFQWIAYNTETKEFMGTGGGGYNTADGAYTENIEFFSKDQSRVGASLKFDFDIQEGKWHHSGLSSKGQPLYEIWSQRN